MRVSTLIKNVFSDTAPEVTVVTKEELDRKIKTKIVLIDPNVIMKLFRFFVNMGSVEGTALLRGKILGEYLVIMDAYCCHNSQGTSTSAIADTRCFSEASKIRDGNYVVGMAHSHVGGIPVFMSSTDRATQKDFQAMFSDAVSMVMNPFTPDGICFRFYRFENGSIRQVRHGYLRCEDEIEVQA